VLQIFTTCMYYHSVRAKQFLYNINTLL